MIAFLIILIVILLVCLIITNFIYFVAIDTSKDKSKIFDNQKGKIYVPVLDEEGKQIISKLKEVYVKSFDNLKLHAYEMKDDKNSNWIILVHGYCGDSKQMISYANKLYENNVNVLMIDLRGHGKSEGNYVSFGIVDRHDIITWTNYLNSKYENCVIGLYGISMGASAVMMSLGEALPKNVKYVIEDSGFASAHDILKYQFRKFYHIPSFPFLCFLNLKIKFKNKYSIYETNCENILKNNDVPILFIHGGEDEIVPTEMMKKLYDSNLGKKDKLIINKAYHTSSVFTEPHKYWNKVIGFINEYSSEGE